MTYNRQFHERSRRSPAGQTEALLLLALLLMVVALGALGIDIAHVMSVRRELQVAVDAGALAGAAHLSEPDPSTAENEALFVTASNRADGADVSTESPGVSVDVTVVLAPLNDPAAGRVTVTAQKNARHMLAPIFGRRSDVVIATATAGGSGGVTEVPAGDTFPLAVSIDTSPDKEVPGREGVKPLGQLHIDDTVFLDIGSQKVKNAAFTSFSESSANANYINAAIDEALGLTSSPSPIIPAVSVGDSLNLNNGIVGQKSLGKGDRYSALTALPYVIMPVVAGDPPFNQSLQVVGFVAIKITDVTMGKEGIVETLKGTIVKPIIRGNAGDPPPWTGTTYQTVFTEISPVTVRLLE